MNSLSSALIRLDFGRYDIVGFSSVFCQSVASLALARLIKTSTTTFTSSSVT